MKNKVIATIAVLLPGFVLLACTDVNDGSCREPVPCHSVEGHNP